MIEDVDVAVIGGGVVGAAIARRLARTRLRVALLDAGPDIGAGTSKANTAILHTGFDTKPGTVESVLVQRGYGLFHEYAAQSGIAIEQTGALLVAWDGEQHQALPTLAERAAATGYDACEVVDARACYEREPHLGPGAHGGLLVPGESVIDPFTPPIAFATEAIRNGAALHRRCAVLGAERDADDWQLATSLGPFRARWVVNAAGLRADEVDRLLGHTWFEVTPRRGELLVFDKLARSLVNGIVLPVPTARTKGVLVAPTVFGNVVLGPTAEDMHDKTDTSSTDAGIEALLTQGRRILPSLVDEDVTAVYVGLRAATDDPDYRLAMRGDDRTVCVGGIRSTGLTASLALAEWVAEGLAALGVDVTERGDVVGARMPNLGEAFPRPYQDAALVARDPLSGRVVCHCERVTAREIDDACRGTIAPVDLDGLRRRTRVLMGRCQGFYCLAEVTRMLADAGGQAPAAILDGAAP